MGMVGEACLPSNAYYPRTPDYTLCSGVHVCWSEHSDSSFVYGFMILDYGFGTMTATTSKVFGPRRTLWNVLCGCYNYPPLSPTHPHRGRGRGAVVTNDWYITAYRSFYSYLCHPQWFSRMRVRLWSGDRGIDPRRVRKYSFVEIDH